MFPELAEFDADTIKRGPDALKIHVADVNAQREAAKLTPFATIGAYLADQLDAHVRSLVRERFTVQRLDRILAALPTATDQQIAEVAQDLGIDLTIDVPPEVGEAMSITTTLGALAQAEPALQPICALKLSAKSAYHVQKLARLVAAETKHFHTERDRYIRDLGTLKDNGDIEIRPTSEHFPEFVKRINELGAVTIEISWSPIALELLGDEKVSATELIALGPLLAEPDV